MRVSILYSELAEYTLACLRALSDQGVEIQLFHWPLNPEAPFDLNVDFISERWISKDLSIDEMKGKIEAFEPQLILCSGWMDRDYVRAVRSWHGVIPTVLSMDNHWRGDLKQRVAQLVSRFTLLQTFSHAFVPGEVQKQYALKLGFQNTHIRTGFYAADVDRFDAIYKERLSRQSEELPKRFLYLGRYVTHKGVFDLWDAFTRFRATHPDWELWCVGTGDQWEHRVEAEGIRHYGFVQPHDLGPILNETSIYILPSHFEPWGVSVQEMAVAGFPMILSDAIGAKEKYLENNGFVYPSGDAEALCDSMRKIAAKSSSELKGMAANSHALGCAQTPTEWAKQLLSILPG